MINLCLYTSRREYCIPLFVHFLKKMKPENKRKIKLSILAYGNMGRFNQIVNELEDNGIEARAVQFSSEYMEKTTWAVRQPFDYTAKIDEDVFLNNFALDFIVENIHTLDEPNHLAVTPMLSNGIPTVDLFVNQWFDESDKDELRKLFVKTPFGPIWGADYTFLNKFTIDSPSEGNALLGPLGTFRPYFDYENFYKALAEWPHFYKGIHPVRINPIAQIRIAEMILEKYIKKFTDSNDFSLIEADHPYLCNNMFFIRTDKWRKIVEDGSLYVDPFDEVPLSKYKQKSGEKWLIVDKSFGIHTIYNTVYGHPGIQEFEMNYVETLKKKVI